MLFLGEKLSARELPPMAVMLFGAMASTYGQWTIVGRGVILLSVAVLFGAAQALIAKVVVPDIHPRVLIIYRNGLGAVCLAAWVLPIGRFDLSAAHLDTWAVVLGGGILGPWAGMMLFLCLTSLLGTLSIQPRANDPTTLRAAYGCSFLTAIP